LRESNKMANKKDVIDNQLTTIPNSKYQKFFDGFKNIDTLPVEQWGKTELLGYFCHKYKQTYNVDYPWKFNHQSPSKCFEVWQFNTLCSKLSANPQILKEYIDWAYLNVVPKAKRRLTSISFLTRDEVVIPYKMDILLGGKKNLSVDRSTSLPSNLREAFRLVGVDVNTYGDLAFLFHMEQTPEIASAFAEIEALGFDKSILERIV
jgi:hypothetical protein